MLAPTISAAMAPPMTTVTHGSPPGRSEQQGLSHPLPISHDEVLERDDRLQAGTITLERAATVDWDVLVIGAGPAGALAARQLSRLGIRTLLVEKSVFPRSKVCGGCLNVEAVEALRIAELGHLAEPPDAIPTRRLALWCQGKNAVLELPGGSAIVRRTFDARLVLEAIECGTEFLPATAASIGDRPISNPSRVVELQASDHRHASAHGRVILAADGLNQVSHRKFAALRGNIAKSGRVGLGAVLSTDDGEGIEPGTIQMAVTQRGYVGLVQAADRRVTIAAAIDPVALKSFPAAVVVCRILAENGILGELQHFVEAAEWRGTTQLTRSHRCVAVDNVLLLGDSAGYVEPFTGDGMAAAFQAALAVEGPVTRYLSRIRIPRNTTGSLEYEASRLSSEWISAHRKVVRSAQWRCRFLAGLLRHPAAARIALQSVSVWPVLARPFLGGRPKNEATLRSSLKD